MSDKDRHDEDLLFLFQQGDEEAFEMLYNRYWEKLLTVAYHRTGCLETAKELVQDVFANLWRRRNQLTIKTTFATYIFSAMKYTVLDYVRSHTVKEKYVEAIKQTTKETDNTTLDFIAYRELHTILDNEVNKLPERCRMVFKLSRIEHYSTKEIAEKLKISPKTVENQLTKALKVLRANMQEFTPLLAIFFSFPC